MFVQGTIEAFRAGFEMDHYWPFTQRGQGDWRKSPRRRWILHAISGIEAAAITPAIKTSR
jgi:hypothetical protein